MHRSLAAVLVLSQDDSNMFFTKLSQQKWNKARFKGTWCYGEHAKVENYESQTSLIRQYMAL